MTLASLFLAVLASFIHASWNLLAKRVASVGPLLVFAYNLVACVAYAPWVVWLLVQGIINWTWAGVGFVLLGGLIHLTYSRCLQRGYQVSDLSVFIRSRGEPARCYPASAPFSSLAKRLRA